MLQVLFFYMFTWWFAKLENKKVLIAHAVAAGIFAIFYLVITIVAIVVVISTEEMVVLVALFVGFVMMILFSIRSLSDIGKIRNLPPKPQGNEQKTSMQNTDMKPHT